MKKQIFTIGYTIPTFDENHVDFYEERSLMDADILLISPDSLMPRGDWVSFTSSDGGCYNVAASKNYRQKIQHLKKEIIDHLNAGKNVFVLLTKEEEHILANSVSSRRKDQNLYSTEIYSNYSFLPVDIGTLTSASGKHVEFSGNQIFNDFYKKFKENLEYQLYIENPNKSQTIFTGKDKTKVLGAIYNIGKGCLIVLPNLVYDQDEFIEAKKNKKGETKHYWNKEATKFGKTLFDCLLEIDQQLIGHSIRIPAPIWVSDEKYSTQKELDIQKQIVKNQTEIKRITEENEKKQSELNTERILKDLLYEQDKPLENAVILALEILGYTATGYDDGVLELDQVINCPEGHRFIGECEGKNEKDINITKFRQLMESLNADFAREEVNEKAFGILFGNPQRLTNPNERTLDFTEKCKIGAKREKIALVKTTDLFVVAKFIKENPTEDFKKKCRDSIYNSLGEVVIFPEIPA